MQANEPLSGVRMEIDASASVTVDASVKELGEQWERTETL